MASADEPNRGGATEAEVNNQEVPSLTVNETFLHGLISNSFHALDKVKSGLGPHQEPDLFIRIFVDRVANTVTIVDNGVGMTKSDIFRHLGAVSGFTKGFVAPPPPSAGLGLLSAYLAADKVVITSKHDDDDQQYRYVWAGGSFTVRPDDAGERLGRGTKVTLFLKDNHLQYLADRHLLEDLVDEYSRCATYRICIDGDEEEEDEEEIIDGGASTEVEEEEEAIYDDDGDASTEDEDEVTIDDDITETEDEEEEEEEAIHDGDATTVTEDVDEEEASWYKSMAKRLDEELKAAIHDGQPNKERIEEALELTKNKQDKIGLYADDDSEATSSGSGGGGNSDLEEDNARLAIRLCTYSTTSSSTGGEDSDLEDIACLADRLCTHSTGEDSEELSPSPAASAPTPPPAPVSPAASAPTPPPTAVSPAASAPTPPPPAVSPAASVPTPPPAAPARSPRTSAASAPTAHSATSFTPLFKQVTNGRCYNCLGSDHFVANCRAPRRCLLCFGTAHIARNCPRLHEQYHGPGAPHRRPLWVGACAPFPADASRTPERADPAAMPPPLLYKARVCIEGVPAHARHPETVAGLFAGFALVESLDEHVHGAHAQDKEAACVCAWVWTLNPDAIARSGTLLIPEPRGPTWPSLLHSDLWLTSCSPSAAGPPQMLPYQVIIHLDRVYDYTPAPGTGVSTGLLWPRCHVFSWRLGVLDGATPPPPY